MTRELASRLVGYKCIPLLFLQPQSPVSPFSRSSPSPKSSTPVSSAASLSPSTTDTSDLDLVDDADFDQDGNIIKKFKRPRKSNIRNIFDYVRNLLLQRGFVGKDGELDNHPLFFALMGEWRIHYENHKTGGMEKFFPVKIRRPTTRDRSATPRKKPTKGAKTREKDDVKSPQITEWDDFIPLYWNGLTLCYGVLHKGFPHLKKCKQCWSQSTSEGYLCNLHSTTRLQHFTVFRDTNEKSIHYHAALSYPSVLKKEWTKQMFQKIAPNVTQVERYLLTHPNANFSPIYENSCLLSSPERLPTTHSITLSVALITLFRNLEMKELEAPIKPHIFLQKEIYMVEANLAVVERTLEANGVTFSMRDHDDISSPLIDKDRYCQKLPNLYCGVESNNQISIGLKTSKAGGQDHSEFTHTDQFKSGPIYQTPLSDEQLQLAATINTHTSFTQWTDQQKDLFNLVRDDCTRKEGLGQAALIVAEMKGQSYKGILIRRDNSKYENVQTIYEGDRAFVQAVYKFLTTRSLTISVEHTDDMRLNDEI
ncbi:uncharacterized protein LOC110849545 [Folsomia candida]|nr:uncharacterized protein LOC110849545 [Folsomia candida]